MILTDMNQTWKAPEGYRVHEISALGAFLVVTYRQTRFVPDTMTPMGYATIQVYVNDQGREVMRTEDFRRVPPQPVYGLGVAKRLSLWERIELWFRVNFRGE